MRGSTNHEEEVEMMQHYPNATQVSDFQRPDAPAAVLQAVRVMYAGAAVCVIQAIVCVLTAASATTHPVSESEVSR
jgi:hypothetical protein